MESLTTQEFTAILEFFHDCGTKGIDFTTAFEIAKKESLRRNETAKA